MSGTLYIVATPIGHLSDMSPRAIDTLRSVDFILAEDPRVTLKLLNHWGISKKVYEFSEFRSEARLQKILDNLEAGQSYALVSDAGTPAVSDPGAELVDQARNRDLVVIPIPGPSALTAFASVCGGSWDSLHFWTFFPIKTKKQRQLVEMIETVPGLHVFFESPFRIEKTLQKYFLEWESFTMVIGREITKQHETFYRGSPRSVLEQLRARPIKGEFCVGLYRTDGSRRASNTRDEDA